MRKLLLNKLETGSDSQAGEEDNQNLNGILTLARFRRERVAKSKLNPHFD